LDKAIENAQNNLGFQNGCPLSNGYHEWEECQMNGKSHMKKSIETELLLLFFNYYRLPVITLIFLKRTRSFNGIARFWHQRANFSKDKNQYVILGLLDQMNMKTT
jgi:maltose phosphorylase